VHRLYETFVISFVFDFVTNEKSEKIICKNQPAGGAQRGAKSAGGTPPPQPPALFCHAQSIYKKALRK
jgi:hypothetical protein